VNFQAGMQQPGARHFFAASREADSTSIGGRFTERRPPTRHHSLPRLGQAARPGMAPTGEFFPDRASMAGKVAVF
jgi:hypothetical protein